MKKRLTMALAAGALVAAMLPGVAAAKATPEEKCISLAAKLGHTGSYIVTVGGNGDDAFGDFNNPGTDLVCGFNGDDTVQVLGGSDIFIGGNGADAVTSLNYGTVYGHNGDDTVTRNYTGGVFYGGKGDDTVIEQELAMFDGGKGYDEVTDCNYISTNINVESVASGAC